ncbi:MAG: hypothetical protein M1818_002771 [Claussenomyces sp. TS43310]|nr:MAG: hypothetical protein M1818_002771 [Claussenomyces sp. TS43310]
MVNQSGLEWVQRTFTLEPRWTVNPDTKIVERLARRHLELDHDAKCEVTFHAQGAFNKLYKIDSLNGTYLMRVTLPVDPHHKTSSEVATIEFIRQNTDVPVPKILAFDASNSNELGFEWILMEMMPGAPLRSKWRRLPMSTKHNLVTCVTRYQAQIFRLKFSGIGNILSRQKGQETSRIPVIKAEVHENEPPEVVLDRIVSPIFFWGDHIFQDVPRGPFRNSYQWLHAQLTFILNDQERILKSSEDEDELEDAENTREIAQRLQVLLPRVFSNSQSVHEPSIIFHHDLSWQNMLVDDAGKLTAIIDWECVSALPLWRACQLPQFLEGRNRDEEPLRHQYGVDDPDNGDDEESLDNEGMNSLYWVHLREYEQTVLRRSFLRQMEELEPSWVAETHEGAVKADYAMAIHQCDNEFCFKIIRKWLDSLERGESWSFRERLIE